MEIPRYRNADIVEYACRILNHHQRRLDVLEAVESVRDELSGMDAAGLIQTRQLLRPQASAFFLPFYPFPDSLNKEGLTIYPRDAFAFNVYP